VVVEDLIDEVPGTDGNAGGEVADPESEDFWEAQATTASQFCADGFATDGLFIAVA
jgi:hypothetical protein